MSQGRAPEGEAACAVPVATYTPLNEPRTSTAAVPAHHRAFLRLRSLFKAMANNPPNRLASTAPRMVHRAPGGRRLLALTIPGITNIGPPGAGVKAQRADHGGLGRGPYPAGVEASRADDGGLGRGPGPAGVEAWRADDGGLGRGPGPAGVEASRADDGGLGRGPGPAGVEASRADDGRLGRGGQISFPQ